MAKKDSTADVIAEIEAANGVASPADILTNQKRESAEISTYVPGVKEMPLGIIREDF